MQICVEKWSEEVCRFLKSLPEGSNMPICAIGNSVKEENDFGIRFGLIVVVKIIPGKKRKKTK